MRIPARFVDHPVETLMAGGLLLLLLLVGSAESGRDVGNVQAATPPTVQQHQKL